MWPIESPFHSSVSCNLWTGLIDGISINRPKVREEPVSGLTPICSVIHQLGTSRSIRVLIDPQARMNRFTKESIRAWANIPSDRRKECWEMEAHYVLVDGFHLTPCTCQERRKEKFTINNIFSFQSLSCWYKVSGHYLSPASSLFLQHNYFWSSPRERYLAREVILMSGGSNLLRDI